jgi:hypothetical protein
VWGGGDVEVVVVVAAEGVYGLEAEASEECHLGREKVK